MPARSRDQADSSQIFSSGPDRLSESHLGCKIPGRRRCRLPRQIREPSTTSCRLCRVSNRWQSRLVSCASSFHSAVIDIFSVGFFFCSSRIPARHFSLVNGACSGTRNKNPRNVSRPDSSAPRSPISCPFDLAEVSTILNPSARHRSCPGCMGRAIL